jgi:hypothetical protein
VIESILSGINDVDMVQQDTMVSVSKFRQVDGDLSLCLQSAIESDSEAAVYSATRLLAALGR